MNSSIGGKSEETTSATVALLRYAAYCSFIAKCGCRLLSRRGAWKMLRSTGTDCWSASQKNTMPSSMPFVQVEC